MKVNEAAVRNNQSALSYENYDQLTSTYVTMAPTLNQSQPAYANFTFMNENSDYVDMRGDFESKKNVSQSYYVTMAPETMTSLNKHFRANDKRSQSNSTYVNMAGLSPMISKTDDIQKTHANKCVPMQSSISKYVTMTSSSNNYVTMTPSSNNNVAMVPSKRAGHSAYGKVEIADNLSKGENVSAKDGGNYVTKTSTHDVMYSKYVNVSISEKTFIEYKISGYKRANPNEYVTIAPIASKDPTNVTS